jgi:hypothetical protein
MPDTPASELAHTLRLVKTKSARKDFVKVSELPADQQLAFELRNVEQSFTHAREHLGLT